MPTFFLILVVVLASCAPRSALERAEPLSDIQPPTFEVVPGQTAIESFDPPGAGANVALQLSARVNNPNRFAINIERIDFDVILSGREVFKGRIEPELFLAPEAASTLRFNIETSLQDKLEVLRAVARAFSDTPLPFRVVGRVTFSSSSYQFQGRETVLFSGETFSRQTVIPPELQLDETASEVFVLAGVPVIQIVFRASNPGDVGYFLYAKDLEASLGGQVIAAEDISPVPIPAQGTRDIEVLFYPDLRRLSPEAQTALEAALEGIPTALELKGTLLMDVLGVDTFTVPEGWRLVGFVDAD